MKFRNTASILTVILWVLWVVPYKGKNLAPELFDSWAIQWTCAIIVAIIIPVVVLKALSMIFTGAQRRAGFCIAVFACYPLLYNLTWYGICGTMLAQGNSKLLLLHERDSELLVKLTDRAVSGDSAEKRAMWAGLLYSTFGAQPVWKDAEGKLARYSPTVEDQHRWERTVDTSKLVRKTTEMIDRQLNQMPWLFGLYLGSFTVIVGVGLAWQTYKTKSEQVGGCDDEKPAS